MAIADDLERLAGLHAGGFLTDEQYESARRRIEEHAAREAVDGSLPYGRRPPLPRQQRPDRIDAGWKIVRSLLLLALIIGGMGVMIRFLVGVSSSSAPSGGALREMVVPRPDPVVVEQSLNDDESSIWDASVTVVGRVRNKGADGRVLIKEVVEQGGKHFSHEEHRYLNHEEDCAVRHTFREVSAGGGRMRGHIEVYPE